MFCAAWHQLLGLPYCAALAGAGMACPLQVGANGATRGMDPPKSHQKDCCLAERSALQKLGNLLANTLHAYIYLGMPAGGCVHLH